MSGNYNPYINSSSLIELQMLRELVSSVGKRKRERNNYGILESMIIPINII